jgi:putative sigma-54 modulation protein
MTMSLAVKSSFAHSSALSAFIERRIDCALHTHAAHISRVLLRLVDVNGPRHGAHDKVARLEIILIPSGHIVATAATDDVYTCVARAALRAKTAVARHIDHRVQSARRNRRAGSVR